MRQLSKLALALATAALLAACATQPAPDVLVPPQLLHFPEISYPPEARRQGQEGLVRVQLHYGASGQVERVMVQESSGHPLLDAQALELARQIQLKPGTRNGVPEAGMSVLPIRFQLQPEQPAEAATQPASAP